MIILTTSRGRELLITEASKPDLPVGMPLHVAVRSLSLEIAGRMQLAAKLAEHEPIKASFHVGHAFATMQLIIEAIAGAS